LTLSPVQRMFSALGRSSQYTTHGQQCASGCSSRYCRRSPWATT